MKTGLFNVPQALHQFLASSLLASSTVKAARVLTGPAALVTSLAFGALAVGCNEGGVGDPCIPEDEYQVDFAGYSEKEVNVESRSFQCETRVCLVNKFRGRVSCKYGGEMGQCETPDGQDKIGVAVAAQLEERRPIDAVYCSCRCAGIGGAKNDGAPYCDCPEGFRCEDLIKDFKLGNKQLAGGYCVKEGTERTPESIDTIRQCRDSNCGEAGDFYN
jgi:hypothetical protein